MVGVWERGGKTRTPLGERTERCNEVEEAEEAEEVEAEVGEAEAEVGEVEAEVEEVEEVMVMCLRETVLWESRERDLRPKVVVVLSGMGIWDWEEREKKNADVVLAIQRGRSLKPG